MDELMEEKEEEKEERSSFGNILEEDTGDTLEEEDSETVSCLVEDVPEGVDSGAWEVVEVLAGVGLGKVELVGLAGGITDGEGVDDSGVLVGEGMEE